MQFIIAELVVLSKKDCADIVDEAFRYLLVFCKIMMCVPPKIMVNAKPLKHLLLATIRSEKMSNRMVGYRIIV